IGWQLMKSSIPSRANGWFARETLEAIAVKWAHACELLIPRISLDGQMSHLRVHQASGNVVCRCDGAADSGSDTDVGHRAQPTTRVPWPSRKRRRAHISIESQRNIEGRPERREHIDTGPTALGGGQHPPVISGVSPKLDGTKETEAYPGQSPMLLLN